MKFKDLSFNELQEEFKQILNKYEEKNMSVINLDGKLLSKINVAKHNNISEKLIRNKIIPSLAVIQIGDDKASSTYVKNKSKACKDIGVRFIDYHLSENVTEEEVSALLLNLNYDDSVHGILIQQPVPYHLKGLEQDIVPEKDVDGFCYNNVGRLGTNSINEKYELIPCTAKGIIDLLDHYKIELEGKHVVIIGRSNIVGKPVANLALNRNATVTVCHSKTKNIKEITKTADILIVAIGKPKFVNSTFLGLNTDVVVDVGINRDENNKLCGDCDYDDIVKFWKCREDCGDDTNRYITPVPGGIGPMTISCLMENVLKASLYK